VKLTSSHGQHATNSVARLPTIIHVDNRFVPTYYVCHLRTLLRPWALPGWLAAVHRTEWSDANSLTRDLYIHEGLQFIQLDARSISLRRTP
jgi:hypothetical protein